MPVIQTLYCVFSTNALVAPPASGEGFDVASGDKESSFFSLALPSLPDKITLLSFPLKPSSFKRHSLDASGTLNQFCSILISRRC